MAIFPFYFVLFKHLANIIILGSYFEFSLNHAVVRAFRDHGSIRLRAHDKRQCTKKNGLTSSGLTCYNDQTLRKINIQRVYQYIVLYL